MSFKYVFKESNKFWRQLLPLWVIGVGSWVVMSVVGVFRTFIYRDFVDSLVSGNFDLSMHLGLALLGLTLFVWIVNTFTEYIPWMASVKALVLLTSGAFRELLKAKPRVVDEKKGDILARLTNDVVQLSQLYAGLLPAMAVHAVRLCTSAFVLLVLSPLLALFTASLVPVYYILYKFFSSRISRASEAERKGFSSYVSIVEEYLNSYELFKRTMAFNFVEKKMGRAIHAWAENYRRLTFLRVVFNQCYHWMFTIMSVSILVFGGLVVARWGYITVGTLIAFVNTAWSLYEPIINLSNIVAQVPAFIPLIVRYYEVLGLEKETHGDIELKSPVSAITLRDLHVILDDKEVLKNVSARLRSGKIVVLMGPSGSGKTTLARVFVRLVDPVKGDIEIEGLDYKSIALKHLRRAIYYVPSKDVILRDTVRENIALGENYSNDEITKALEIAGVDFVKNLDQEIAPENLSDGQKQRVAIARAVVRKPSVLILDEALNAVEEWREKQILENIKNYLKDSLIIVISHRSSALKIADEVYVLENGTLVKLEHIPG